MPFDEYGNYYVKDRVKPRVQISSKFKAGEFVHPFQSTYTNKYFWNSSLMYRIKTFLGKRCEIVRVEEYSALKLRIEGKPHTKPCIFHEKDVSYENKYINLWDTAPKWLTDIKDMPNISKSGYYCCSYLLYKDRPKGWWKKLPLEETYEKFEYAFSNGYDPCEDAPYCHCLQGGCEGNPEINPCKKRIKYMEFKDYVYPLGRANTNHACWAQFHRHVENMMEKGTAPDRMIVKLGKRDLPNKRSDPEDLDFKDVCDFFKYMIKAKCLPSYIKPPTMNDCGKDLFFTVRLDTIDPNRLFWYMNVFRTVCEHQMTTHLTCHFIRKAKMEPLMAFVMGHICNPKPYLGHSVMIDLDWGRLTNISYINGTGVYPNMKEVIRYTIKAKELLTQKIEPNIGEEKFYKRWNLSKKMSNLRIKFKSEDLSLEESSTFNVYNNRSFKEK